MQPANYREPHRLVATARILCHSEPRLHIISVSCSRSGSSLSHRLQSDTPRRRIRQYAGCFDDIWLSNVCHTTQYIKDDTLRVPNICYCCYYKWYTRYKHINDSNEKHQNPKEKITLDHNILPKLFHLISDHTANYILGYFSSNKF